MIKRTCIILGVIFMLVGFISFIFLPDLYPANAGFIDIFDFLLYILALLITIVGIAFFISGLVKRK